LSHVIGIDVGTSGIKIGAMDHEGKLCFLSRASYSLQYPFAGAVEVDPNEIWQQVCVLMKQIANDIVHAGGNVAAICFSTFCNASILMDHNGNHLGNGILYMDKRSKREADWIRSAVPEDRIFCITGNRMEPGMMSATSLLWVQKYQPDQYTNCFKWGHLCTYLIAKLTGAFVMDWTQASFTGLFDITHYCWSTEMCSALGINETLLPDIVEPGRMVGHTSSSLMEELGFTGIPVIAGAADTASSTFALGMAPGEVFESVGTSDVLTVVSNSTDRFDKRFLNRCHVVKDQWLSHGAMSTPGAAVQWFYDEFLSNDGDIQDVFERLPAQSPVGSNGVLFLPYMHGERSPIWDPDARGMFIGLTINTRKEDMARAILEGCSFGMRQLMTIIHEQYRLFPEVLTAIGGGSKNGIWNQIKANVLATEIETMEVGETALMGACFLAGLTIGMYTQADIVNLSRGNKMHRYIPNTSLSSDYQKYYDLFSGLYPCVKDFYKKAAHLNDTFL
jgi:xylulokinase